MAPKRLNAMRRWGKEFGIAREEAGFTQVSLARHPDVHISHQTISHWELGLKRPRLEDLRACESVMGTGHLERLLLEWVSLEVSPEWAEWVDVEAQASGLLMYENTVIHGLLQSQEYMETILPQDKLELRRERQKILEDGDPPNMEFLLDESILYRKVGTSRIMAEALNHLVDMGGRDNVIIRIIPLNSDLTRFSYPFALATVEGDGRAGQIGYMEGALRGSIVEHSADIAELQRLWGRYSAQALTEQQSSDLIRKTTEDRWPVT
jgi:transcriptional regulator with XRE-family HTH domain